MFRRNWAQPGLKMWKEIFNYWPEALVGFISWCVVVYFSLKIWEEFNIRKQRRRYREEDDIGRRPKEEVSKNPKAKTRGSPKGVRKSPAGKRGIQKRVEHAKRELLSG